MNPSLNLFLNPLKPSGVAQNTKNLDEGVWNALKISWDLSESPWNHQEYLKTSPKASSIPLLTYWNAMKCPWILERPSEITLKRPEILWNVPVSLSI